MAHTIEEARVMARVAAETGLVTQMGNQGHAGEGLRQIREWIQAGRHRQRPRGPRLDATGRANSGNSRRRGRPQSVPVPASLDWDLWLGSAPMRPYSPVYCPVGWRAWFDFGNGALGRHGDP